MNLTYLAITGGIVLSTMVVYALLSWLHGPSDAQSETHAPQAGTRPNPRSRRRSTRGDNTPVLTTDSAAVNAHHDPS